MVLPRGRVVGRHHLDKRRGLNPQPGPTMEGANRVGQQLPRLDNPVLAGRGHVGRAGKREHAAFAQSVQKHGRANLAPGAHRPVGSLLALPLADGAMGLQQLADGGCACRLVGDSRSFD